MSVTGNGHGIGVPPPLAPDADVELDAAGAGQAPIDASRSPTGRGPGSADLGAPLTDPAARTAGSDAASPPPADLGNIDHSNIDHSSIDHSTIDHSGEVLTAAHAEARERAEGGDLTGARTLLEEALAAGELRHGRDHPQLAPLMVDLATIARNVGNLTEAQNQLRRAYGIVVATAGPEHATSLSIEGRLAAVNYRLGEPTEAYDWHIADVGSRVLGPEHPAVRGAQQRLAATPVHEEQTPPVEAPPDEWPRSYAAIGYAQPPPGYQPPGVAEFDPVATDDAGGWAPGYAPVEAADLTGHPDDTRYPDVTGYPADTGYPTSTRYAADVPYVPGAIRAPAIHAVEPPPREFGQVDVWADPVGAIRRTRGHAGGVALVASLGLAIIAAAVVIAYQLFGPGSPSPTTATQPTSTPAGSVTASPSPTQPDSPSPSSSAAGSPVSGVGLPPAQVKLKDDGGSVTLTWLDPSGGRVPFIVSFGRVGEAAGPEVSVPAGRTSQTIVGLNPRYNYCFTVAAVWAADMVMSSTQTCTNRAATTTMFTEFRSGDRPPRMGQAWARCEF